MKRGTRLVRLDTSAEEAQLASALAEATLAWTNLERARALRRGGANAQADLGAALHPAGDGARGNSPAR